MSRHATIDIDIHTPFRRSETLWGLWHCRTRVDSLDCELGVRGYCEKNPYPGLTSNDAATEYRPQTAIIRSHCRLTSRLRLLLSSCVLVGTRSLTLRRVLNGCYYTGATIFCGLKTANLQRGQTVAIIAARASHNPHRIFGSMVGKKRFRL